MANIAVVTGSNKGIGFSVVKGLCQRFDGIVYLTSRNRERGKKAVQDLEALGFRPKYHQLDITDKSSIESFRDHIKYNHGGLDILVNNAGIYKEDDTEPIAVKAEQTLKVNYFGVLDMCNAFLPIMNKGGRVINVTSSSGHPLNIPSPELRAEFTSKSLTVEALTNLVNRYIQAAKSGTNLKEGWGNSSYDVSKVAASALTFALQRAWDSKGLLINCVHPGYVVTDLTSHTGLLSQDRGAQSTIFAALDAPDTVKGAYIWDNNVIIDWYSSNAIPADSTE